MLGLKKPDSGTVKQALNQVGYISQSAANWRLKESLFEYLWKNKKQSSNEDILSIIIAHKFPLGLAEKPMLDLSPGERLRAALIGLFTSGNQQFRSIDYLVLDEPTVSLDGLALKALKQVLKLWKGGLIIVSHDKQFLDDINIDVRTHLSNGKLNNAFSNQGS